MINKSLVMLFAVLLSIGVNDTYAACLNTGVDSQLCETREALYQTGEGSVVAEKAAGLGNAVKIYEFIRNNAEYTVYHGARSNSINSMLGMRGNDVDLASTLVAMMRSQGIKSRYAVGDIKIKKNQLSNWLNVVNNDLAVSLLRNQGIQNVDGTDPVYVTFEHVWVEVLVDYHNYRAGNTTQPVGCVTEGESCQWISLDPSYKQKTYKNVYRMLLREVDFNYNAYFNAENPASPDFVAGMKNKNPLEIFEEQALEYLRINHPGVTLEDVIDNGEIISDESGLLPASLPYEVVSAVTRYDSVSAYDMDPGNTVDWSKYLTSTMQLPGCSSIGLPTYRVKLAELSTKQLTLTIFDDAGTKRFAHRLDGEQVGSSISAGGTITFNCGGITTLVTIGTPIDVKITIEAAPDDDPVTVEYAGLIFGGYYLIASGGETSNWTQVRRAYKKLLSANDDYVIVVDDSGAIGDAGVVYVDTNANGSADIDDVPLLNHLAAQDALTGGLLHVAQTIYYTRLREESERYSRMKGIISPVAAYVGIVSTTHEVEYLDDVPFAVTPGGLLIDLKGIRINGSWEIDQAEIYSNETFKFIGHNASSLEHEVWQEITGYDAISTMRGIQMALSKGESLLDVNYNSPVNTFPAAILDLGFSSVPPVGFTQNQRSLFNRELVTWAYSGADSNPGFNAVLPDASTLAPTDNRARWLSYGGNNGLDAYVGNMDSLENQLQALTATEGQLKVVNYNISGLTGLQVAYGNITSPSGFTVDNPPIQVNGDVWRFTIRETSPHPDGIINLSLLIVFTNTATATVGLTMDVSDDVSMTCSGVPYSGPPSGLLIDLENCFNTVISSSNLTGTIDFLDVNNGFNPANHAYRSYSLGIDEYNLEFMKTLRNNMYFLVNPDAWSQYLLPTRFSQGPNYLFNVYIKNTYLIDDLVSSTYAIVNHSNRLAAGGGYVTAEETIDPAVNVEFNNEVFTNLNLVSVANNDVIRTPSTADPVSTVTGNMYHDETDIVIKGRGLDYAFTRTYNSDQVKTTTASDFPLSKGWTHAYNMRLIANDYGQNPNFTTEQAPENGNGTTSSITYVNERGGELNYLVDDVDSTWAVTAPRMSFDQLQLDVPVAGAYTLTFRNGVNYIFSGADLKVPGNTARLTTIQDPYGNELGFGYNVNGQLVSITDNTGIAGRTGLVLTYYPVGHESEGHLNTVSDWTGRSWTYRYTNGQLTGVSNPLNDGMVYTYVPGTDLLEDIVHPERRNGQNKRMKFSYYENDQAYAYVDTLDNIESVTYDLFRKRTRITNPRGFITEHYYDENGAMVKLVEPDKAILQFANNEDGLRYLKRDALGNATTYSYHSARTLAGAATDTFGQVTREQDALGNTIDYTYGIYDQLTRVKNKNDIETVSNYYATTNLATGALKGKLQDITLPTAKVNGVDHVNVVIASYQYHADGTVKRIEEFIDPAMPTRKRVTDLVYSYDANGFTLTKTMTGATAGVPMTTTQRYDALWRLASESVQRRTSATDATVITITTGYEYDSLNRPVKVTDTLGNIVENQYDKNGQVTAITERYALTGINDRAIHDRCTIDAEYPGHHSCIVTTRRYDVMDRLISESNISGATTRYGYDEMGNITQITNALGHSLHNEYDKRGRLLRVTNENGYSIKTEYDLAGRVKAVIDGNGNATRFSYDALGRQTSMTTPEGRVTRFDDYDGNGNLLKVRDANAVAGTQPVNSRGASRYQAYDEFNRMVYELNANNEPVYYRYDLLGNLTQVVDANNQITEFIYDDMGRLIAVKDPVIETPVDKIRVYTHDELGNILTATDRNGAVVRTRYDSLNRVIQAEYLSDFTTQAAQYNQYGELDQISNEAVTYRYVYDNQRRMTRKTDSRHGLTLDWGYNEIGRVVSKFDYQNVETKFTYDNTGRLIAMANKDYVQASYHYDAAGRLLSRILSNGAATLYHYDKDGFLIKITQRSSSGDVIDERRYTQDSVGNITQIAIVGGDTTHYGYDPAYRLTQVNASDVTNNQTFSYDGVGNRLSKTHNGVTSNYTYSIGNRLDELRHGTTRVFSYDYDDNGSRINKRNSVGAVVESYEYNQKRLITQMNSTGSVTNFAYDPNRYRIQKSSAVGTNHYLLEAEHLESVYDENNQLKSSYLRGVVVDEIINGFERDVNGNMLNRTFHHDQVNSVLALSDHNGVTAQKRAYTPFGLDLSSSGASTNSLAYTGREQDNENSLYYYRARYYDPEVGRFMSEDPLGFEAGINFYAYVGNNPLNFNDPSGKVCVPCITGFISGTGAAIASVYSGNDLLSWETAGAFGAGFVVGSGLAALGATSVVAGLVTANTTAGLSGAVALSEVVVGAFGAVSSDAILQGSNIFGGEQSNFDFSRSGMAAIGGVGGSLPAVIRAGSTLPAISNLGPRATQLFINSTAPTVGEMTLLGAASTGIGIGTDAASNFFSDIFSTSAVPTPSAAGGFVLYPNRLNTNMVQGVYSK
ncbi:MAG: DUF6531 domain-containing protein [Gammaproteobacteria bacterium]|nr:DUF6531 domain-containing protein [Gammaproteobacteria bacterium]